MSGVPIRQARKADVSAICNIATASWHAAYDEFLGPETVEAVLDRWYDPEALESQVADPTSPFLVAEDDGRPVGYVNAGPDPDREETYHLWRLYVHPDRWGEGIGTALLTAVQDELGGDRDVLELTVLAENGRARSFYESHGFELVDRKPTALADTSVVECVYRKPLARRRG